MVPTPGEPCYFFEKLPREIRDEIYAYAYDPDEACAASYVIGSKELSAKKFIVPNGASALVRHVIGDTHTSTNRSRSQRQLCRARFAVELP